MTPAAIWAAVGACTALVGLLAAGVRGLMGMARALTRIEEMLAHQGADAVAAGRRLEALEAHLQAIEVRCAERHPVPGWGGGQARGPHGAPGRGGQ